MLTRAVAPLPTSVPLFGPHERSAAHTATAKRRSRKPTDGAYQPFQPAREALGSPRVLGECGPAGVTRRGEHPACYARCPHGRRGTPAERLRVPRLPRVPARPLRGEQAASSAVLVPLLFAPRGHRVV